MKGNLRCPSLENYKNYNILAWECVKELKISDCLNGKS